MVGDVGFPNSPRNREFPPRIAGGGWFVWLDRRLPAKFGGAFTSSTGYGCPNIARVDRHRRHIDGTQDTPDHPAIYATYVPPMLSWPMTM
jgi:hypothetical protein